MSDQPQPRTDLSLEDLIEKSKRLREQSEKLHRDMRELETLIVAAAKARTVPPERLPHRP